ncbi:hypothetical protein EMMF5_004507 [Cystobasidiomycetes sp. EMM_F5]
MAVIQQATKTSWDVTFLKDERIKKWLMSEVKIHPLDTTQITLYNYVRQRMAAAKLLQEQANERQRLQLLQQQQEEEAKRVQAEAAAAAAAQAEEAARSHAAPLAPSNSGHHQLMSEFVYDVEDMASAARDHEDDDAYSFALDVDNFASTSANAYGRSPSPMPAPLSMTSTTQQPAYDSAVFRPFSSGLAPPLPSTMPHNTVHTQHPVPTVMNPALLSLNNQPQQSHIQYARLDAIQNSNASNGQSIDPKLAVISPNNTLLAETIPTIKREREVSAETSPAKRVKTLTSSTASAMPKEPDARAESELVWQRIEPEVRKQLALANKAPISAVSKLFKYLSLYVTEPEDATSTGVREAMVTSLSVPPDARRYLLHTIKEITKEAFDECFVTDPRATVLLVEWAKDLVPLAKGKAKIDAHYQALKATARPLLEVLRKLPINLPILRSLKGIGRNVQIISQSDVFDEVTKDFANQLVRRWTAMAAPGGVKPVVKKRSESPLPQAPGEDAKSKKRKTSPPMSDTMSLKKSHPALNAAIPKIKQETKVKPDVATAPSAAAARPAATSKVATTVVQTQSVGKALPSFAKRKPLAAARPVTAATAASATATASVPVTAPVSAAFDPFAQSLLDMQAELKAKDNPLGASGSNDHASGDGSKIVRASKKKKTLRWQPDDKLEQIRIFEPIAYGDADGNPLSAEDDYFEKMGGVDEHAEGAALHGLREEVDWEEPPEVDMNLLAEAKEQMATYPTAESLNGMECERDIQEKRELSSLAVSYFSDADIPPTPGEPAPGEAEAGIPDAEVPHMRLPSSFALDAMVQPVLAFLHPDPMALLQQIQPLSGATLPPDQLAISSTVLPGADLSSLLASLNPSALAPLNGSSATPPLQYGESAQPPYYAAQGYAGYNGPLGPPGPSQAYPTNGWGTGPTPSQSNPVNWNHVGPVSRDAYKRIKRGNGNGGPPGGRMLNGGRGRR